ncbi:MAG: fibronectin-binding autotransporter adhesin, partial [Bacteroidia bacterium]
MASNKSTKQVNAMVSRAMRVAAVLPSVSRLRPLAAYMLEQGLLATGLIAGQLLLAPLTYAGPEGGVVISGQGNVNTISPTHTDINQQSQNLLMNFDSFDVSSDESVLITQPNAGAWFVGQVEGGSPTSIFGSITANGKIALINTSGVVFGENARVNAAGIFASSLGVNANDIFSGNIELEAAPGSGGYVVNHGLIQASVGGSVTLLGETVSNSGVIVATLGQVNLASGNKAVVNFGPEQLIGIEVTEAVLENNEGLKAAVSNTGSIDASGGVVMLTSSVSRSLFDNAINNEGVIRARGAEYKDGVIRLFGQGGGVLNTGVLETSATDGTSGGQIVLSSDVDTIVAGEARLLARSNLGTGGQVDILGDTVAIQNQALVDVSGATGGGVVNVNATKLVDVTGDVRLIANALAAGDGGQINITGQDLNIAGSIAVQGGADSGDGGSATLTASQQVEFSGSVDASAKEGRRGDFVINAPTLTVDDSGAGALSVAALEASNTNLTLNAQSQVVIDDLSSNQLRLQGDLAINVIGSALGSAEEQTIVFTTRGANDTISTDGTITVQVTDGSVSANALIDLAGKMEAEPLPAPLPNDPMRPADTISLAATNGRIRVRSTASLHALADDSAAGRILLSVDGITKVNESGTILFSGVADASSDAGVGGSVKLLADRVGLFELTDIDVSGALGGGEILVGGNYQGLGIEATASRTYVGGDVMLVADATELGNGGRVIIWSDENTKFYGGISAHGGPQGGDGGFSEVSSKESLTFRGDVSLAASVGAAGTLLLDPRNIVVASGGGDDLAGAVGIDDDGFAETYSFAEDLLAISTIAAGTITALTDIGTAVVLQANNDITVNEAITTNAVGPGGDLTLQAGRSVFINANITTDGGTFTVIANDTAANEVQRIDATGAELTIASGVDIDTGSGDISLTMSTGTGGIGEDSGDIIFERLTTTGHVFIGQAGQTLGSSVLRASAASRVTAASLTIDISNAVNTTGTIGFSGAALNTTISNLELRTQGGASYINEFDGLIIGSSILGGLSGINVGVGDFELTTAGAISQTEALVSSGLTTLTAPGSSILLGGSNDFGTVVIGGTTTTHVTINDTNAIVLGDMNITGNADIDAGGLLTATSVTTNASGTIDLDTSSGGIIATSVVSADTASITAAAGDITLGSVTAAGAVDITATLGSINDATTDTVAADVSGSAITLIAATGIGSTQALEFVDSASVNASVTGTGNINLQGLGALTLGNANTAAGSITVGAAGALVATLVDATGGLVDLDAAGLLTATSVTTNTSGIIDLDTSSGGIIATSVGSADTASITA